MANVKFGDLPSSTTVAPTDIIPYQDGSTGQTKYITAGNALSASNLQFGGSGSGIWWQEIARTTLTLAADTMTVSSIPNRKYLQVVITCIASGGTVDSFIRFNNDATGIYYASQMANGTYIGSTAVTSIPCESGSVGSGGANFVTMEIYNPSTNSKFYHSRSTAIPGGGAAAGALTIEGFYVSNSVLNRIDVTNVGTGDFAVGSEIIVLGHD